MHSDGAKKILIVDPDAAAASATADVLAGFGYDTSSALSGAEALDLFRADARIGLALVDVALAGDPDSALTARLLTEIRELPIVFIDAAPGGPGSSRVAGLKRYGYVTKGATPFILASVLETAFELFAARSLLSGRVRTLDAIHAYSLRLDIEPRETLYRFILSAMQDIFGARFACVSSYDPELRDLVLEDFASASDDRSLFASLLGRGLKRMRFPVPADRYGWLVDEKIGAASSISELSFGVIPPAVGGALEAAVGADWFRGLALVSERELFGSLVLVGTSAREPPAAEELLVFAEITAGALRRKLAERRVAKLLKEKELLLAEVHHRIKNNMNSVISLLSIHSDSVADPDAAEALRDAQARLHSMGVLYDKLYRTEDLRELSLAEYIPALAREIVDLFPAGSSVAVETRIDDIKLPVKTMASLGIILNELITNSMKYAFSGRPSGTIAIAASRRGRRVRISVADDGRGFEPIADLGASPGFGLRLVHILAEQIGAAVRMERGAGARFIIDLDLDLG